MAVRYLFQNQQPGNHGIQKQPLEVVAVRGRSSAILLKNSCEALAVAPS